MADHDAADHDAADTVIEIVSGPTITDDELLRLYDSVGWSAYTRAPATLRRAIDGSSVVATARAADGTLVGLARGLTDGATIFYLQDVLVHPAFHRRGLGAALVQVCLDRYAHVRQKVLLTDDDEAQHRLYQRLGYVDTVDFAAAPLHAFVRFDG